MRFYPPDGSRGTKARRICARCLVRAQCLDYVLTAGEKHGIWGGGLDPDEQANLKRRLRRRVSARGGTSPGGDVAA
jgi:WhiB family redox-sensing transcriptional regulator